MKKCDCSVGLKTNLIAAIQAEEVGMNDWLKTPSGRLFIDEYLVNKECDEFNMVQSSSVSRPTDPRKGWPVGSYRPWRLSQSFIRTNLFPPRRYEPFPAPQVSSRSNTGRWRQTPSRPAWTLSSHIRQAIYERAEYDLSDRTHYAWAWCCVAARGVMTAVTRAPPGRLSNYRYGNEH